MKPFPEYKSDWYDKKKEFMQMNCSVWTNPTETQHQDILGKLY
jgi:hypothetical protein